MRSVITVTLMLLVLLQGFNKTLVLLDFTLNNDFIVKNLCVNRNNPCSRCKGSCYLSKKLLADNNDTNTSGNMKVHLEDICFIKRLTEKPLPVFLPARDKKISYTSACIAAGYLSAVFHPPSARIIFSDII